MFLQSKIPAFAGMTIHETPRYVQNTNINSKVVYTWNSYIHNVSYKYKLTRQSRNRGANIKKKTVTKNR